MSRTALHSICNDPHQFPVKNLTDQTALNELLDFQTDGFNLIIEILHSTVVGYASIFLESVDTAFDPSLNACFAPS